MKGGGGKAHSLDPPLLMTLLLQLQLLSNNPSLQHLLLNNCNVQELGIKKIANALRYISSLLSLDISNNQITAKIELKIADAVNPALQLHV